jgi:hypothetical protein
MIGVFEAGHHGGTDSETTNRKKKKKKKEKKNNYNKKNKIIHIEKRGRFLPDIRQFCKT